MTNKFSLGIFLNILTLDRNKWQEDINLIKTISNLNHLEIWSEVELSTEDIDWLKESLGDYQLIIHGPFTGLSLVSGHNLINQTTINIYKNFIDQAIALNAKLITIHTGKYPTYFDSQKATEIFSKNFRELIDYANNRIVLTTENMPNKHGAQNDFPVLTELIDISKLIPNINYTFDVGHCLENGEDYFEFIKNNKDRIRNIHLHNAVKNGKSHYGLQLSGDLDTKKFINFLNEIDYQGFLTIEVLTDEDKIESVKLIQS